MAISFSSDELRILCRNLDPNAEALLSAAVDSSIAASFTTDPIYYDVRTYGAVANGNTDCRAAIQAALDAAGAAFANDGSVKKTVYLPAGRYYLSGPVHIKGPGVKLVGAGRSSGTKVYTQGLSSGITYEGPAVLASYDEGSPTLAAAISTNGTGSLPVSSTDATTYNLRTGPSTNLDGLSTITIECFFTRTSATGGQWFGSSGQRSITESEHICFQFHSNGAADFMARMDVGGTTYVLTAAGLNDLRGIGVRNHMALVLSGNVLSLYCNGNRLDTEAVSGTIVQKFYENIWIGAKPSQWLSNGSVGQAKDGYLESIRITQTARYSGDTYTEPTAALTYDDSYNILCWVPCSQVDGMFLVGKAQLNMTSYYLACRNGIDPAAQFMEGVEVRHIEFVGSSHGGDVILNRCIESVCSDLMFTFCWFGLMLRDNCFDSSLQRIRALNIKDAQCCLAVMSASGLVSANDLDLFGANCTMYVSGSSIIGQNAYLVGANRVDLMCINDGGDNSSAVFSGFVVSDEGSSVPPECALFVSGFQNFNFIGGTIEQANAFSTAASLVKFDSVANMTFTGVDFFCNPSATKAIFTAIGGTAANEVTVRNCRMKYANTKVCYDASDVIAPGHVYWADKEEQTGSITVTGAATTGALTFTNPMQDTTYVVSVVASAVSAGAAAGASRIRSIAKTRNGITVTVEAAPSGSETVTFDVLVRPKTR